MYMYVYMYPSLTLRNIKTKESIHNDIKTVYILIQCTVDKTPIL